MKKKKLYLDIVMTLLFIAVMGYHLWSNRIHEWLGMLLCVLFIIHHLINRQWYKGLLKGTYGWKRWVFVLFNTLLGIAMVICAVSGIMISRDVLPFMSIGSTALGRELHLVSSAWFYILTAIHIGFHLNEMMAKIKKTSYYRGFNIIRILMIILGIYLFCKRNIWQDMLMITEFKFFDFSESILHFYFEYFGILFAFSLITQLIFNMRFKHSKPLQTSIRHDKSTGLK